MASTLYDAEVDVKSAQKFLGHSDIQVTLKSILTCRKARSRPR